MRKPDWAKIAAVVVFATLAASAAYALANALLAPSELAPGAEFRKVKSDYVLMFIQCALGILVMFLPSMIERRWRIEVPGAMYFAFVAFLYAAIYLGEIRSFYYRIPDWDMVLHGFSGLMLGSLGFSVVSLLNDSEKVSIRLSPVFVALFAFSFAVLLGVLWEVYEFALDGLLGLNMQKYALEDGTRLVGRGALADTMGDLIVDSLGALATSVAGWFSLKHRKGWVERLELRRSPSASGGKAADARGAADMGGTGAGTAAAAAAGPGPTAADGGKRGRKGRSVT